MGISYTVSKDGTLVRTRLPREIDEDELLDHMAALVADSRLKPGFRQLVDATATRRARVGPDLEAKIGEIHREHADLLRGSRVAVVIQDLQVYEAAKGVEEMHESVPVVIVFYSMDVAKIWLGCEAEPEPPDESAR